MANAKKETEKKTTTAKKTTTTKKPAAKKSTSSKTTAAKKATTAKKVAAPKTTAKKVATKKSTSSKTTAAKATTAKKVAAQKTATKKATTTTKKVAATKKTTTTKKPAVKKEVAAVKSEEKKEVKNNNIVKIVAIIIVLILFFAIVFIVSNKVSKGEYTKESSGNTTITDDVASESANIKEDEMGELTAIDIDEYLDIKADSEYAVIYIGRPTCSHCAVQLPIMKYMVYKYGVTINYLNTDELDDDGFSKLQKSDDYFSEGWGTPLILIVKDDKIVDKSAGETSIEDLTDMFKKYNLISE